MLNDLASDNLLTPVEKPPVMQAYAVILAEQAGITAQASAAGASHAAYDTAVSALTTYLATLTTPTAWNSNAGNTTIDGATFRTKFADVYTTKQAVLDAIAGRKVNQGFITTYTATATGSTIQVFNVDATTFGNYTAFARLASYTTGTPTGALIATVGVNPFYCVMETVAAPGTGKVVSWELVIIRLP